MAKLDFQQPLFQSLVSNNLLEILICRVGAENDFLLSPNVENNCANIITVPLMHFYRKLRNSTYVVKLNVTFNQCNASSLNKKHWFLTDPQILNSSIYEKSKSLSAFSLYTFSPTDLHRASIKLHIRGEGTAIK